MSINNKRTGIARLFTANGVVLSLLAAIMLLAGVIIPNVTSAKSETISAHSVGELHNEGLIYVLKHLTVTDLVDRENLTEKASHLVDEFIAESDLTDTKIRVRVSKQGQAVLNELDSIVHKEPSLEEFYEQLDALERKTKRLRTQEKAYVSGAISVARYSGTLWAPVEAGGLNGREYLPNSNKVAALPIDWGDIVAADINGFATEFLSSGSLLDALAEAIIASFAELIRQLFGID